MAQIPILHSLLHLFCAQVCVYVCVQGIQDYEYKYSYYFWGFGVYIFVDLVKRNVTIVLTHERYGTRKITTITINYIIFR